MIPKEFNKTVSYVAPSVLFLFPLVVYLASYIYLAFYHHKVFIFNTIVHENGVHTFLETAFFASHFLGHIPVHTVLALFFVGTFLCLTERNTSDPKLFNMVGFLNFNRLTLFLVAFLTFSVFISLKYFGTEDTFSFILQQKQSEVVYTHGGSWNLHLPSTLLLFGLIPYYIYIFLRIFSKEIVFRKNGLLFITVSLLLFLFMTVLLNSSLYDALIKTWGEPRYLAHSVREIATFPLIYFPIPLAIFILNSKNIVFTNKLQTNSKLQRVIFSLFGLFLLGFLYQVYISLNTGVASMAQTPVFADEDGLGTPYLLSFHYFEHFLDTIYFTLISLMLFSLVKSEN